MVNYELRLKAAEELSKALNCTMVEAITILAAMDIEVKLEALLEEVKKCGK